MNVTGFSTSPAAKRRCVLAGLADANTSAGAPCLICVSRVFEPPKLYLCPGSYAFSTSVSDAAA